MIPKRLKRPKMGLREPSVIRCPQFLKYVRSFDCATTTKDQNIGLCGGHIEAAHVRIGTDGGVGMKPSDCYALPLCSDHHRHQHAVGEKAFEKETGISMREVADQMWAAWLKTGTGLKWKLAHG